MLKNKNRFVSNKYVNNLITTGGGVPQKLLNKITINTIFRHIKLVE